MPTMQLDATLTAADVDTRTLRARLLTFGEEGRTNLGRVRVTAGRVELPTEPGLVHLNMQHDRNRPLGKATSIIEDSEGLTAEFQIARTSAGDDLLEEVRTGLRAAASVELDEPVIRRGELISGRLSAVAAVVAPAFPSATLMVAADCGDLPTTQEDTMPTPAEPARERATDTEAAEAAEETTTDTTEEVEDDTEREPLVAARAPLGVQAPRPKARERQHSILTASQLLASIAQDSGGSTRMTPRLIAALDEITSADTLDYTEAESFEGKIWQGTEYTRQFIGITTTEALTALKYRGWKWAAGKKPVMAAYAGFPAEPPSNQVQATEDTWEPDMYGGAWQFDRKHRDFSDPQWWAEFFTAVATSYAKESDLDHLGALVAGATAVDVDTVNDLPAGVPEGLWKLIKGIRAVKPTGMPTFAVIEWDLWEEIMLTPQDQILPYLKLAMGVENGEVLNFQMKPDEDVLTAGQVLVGVDKAAKFRELPGASPIRVDAELISKGGIEQGVFAYAGTQVREAAGLALVDTVAP